VVTDDQDTHALSYLSKECFVLCGIDTIGNTI